MVTVKRLLIGLLLALAPLAPAAAQDPFLAIPTTTVSRSVSDSSASVALTTGSERDLLIQNVGSNEAFVELGSSTVTATLPSGATPGSWYLPPGASITVQRAGATHLAAIANTGETTTVYATAGRGLGTVTAATSASSGGGGSSTQYTEGDTDATITGTAVLFEGAANTLTSVASATPLPVTAAALEALILGTQADNVANTADGLQASALLYGFDGATWDRLPGNSSTGLTVNGTVAVSALGTAVVATAGADDQANTLDQFITSGWAYWFDGTTWDRARGDSTDGLLVNLGSNNDVTVTSGTVVLGAGTAGIGKLTANSGVDIGDVDVTSISAGNNNIGDVDVASIAAGNNNIGDVDVASIAAGANLIGKVDHATTGIIDGVTTVTTAGTDVALAGSTAAKWCIIQSQTDNTNGIAVGATGVDATVATGDGIWLAPGQSVTLAIDNLADVFIDSLVNGEGVRYTCGN